MKTGIYKATTLILLLICACAAVMFGCRSDQEADGSNGSSGGVVTVPHGYCPGTTWAAAGTRR